LLTDHLGSTSITATRTGGFSSELRYKAWGETRYSSGSTPTTFRYTGQREESSLGLYWYASRWYSPGLGRFVSPDTIIPQPGSPQAWDRYSYTYNNPIIYTDPSGHCGILCGVLIAIGAIMTMNIGLQIIGLANEQATIQATMQANTPVPVPTITTSATGPTPTPTITSTPAPTSTNMDFDDYASTAIQGAEDYFVENGEDIFDLLFEPGPMVDPSFPDLFVGYPQVYSIAESMEIIGNGIYVIKEEYKKNYNAYNQIRPTQALQTPTATMQPTRTATPRPPLPSPTSCYTTPTSNPY